MIEDSNKGFTLIELLLTLLIALIVLAAVYEIFIVSHRNYVIQAAINEMQHNVRATIEFMGRELRNAVVIEEVDANSITFYTDCDNSIVSTSTGENSGNTLNDTTKSWDHNTWQDKKVKITGGTGAGQIRTITTNDTDTLTVSNNWTTTPDSTSVYHILEKKRFLKSDDNILRYTKGGGVNRSFTENITNIDLNYDPGSGKIDIELTARTSRKDPQMNNQYHYYTVKSIVILRN